MSKGKMEDVFGGDCVGSDSNLSAPGYIECRNFGMCFLLEKRSEPVANCIVRIVLMYRVGRYQLNREIMRIEGAIQ